MAASMADTRLPFKGTLAFDRNSQEYVPFKTKSDSMLASLMLAYRLASPILAVVLAVVRHPDFNPAEITLQKPEDVWHRVSDHEARLESERAARRNTYFPIAFPHVVLEHVIDILAAERTQKVYEARDIEGPYTERLVPERMERNLRSVSLVCREWTQPAQRALGRILCLHNVQRIHLVNAINGPLFGRWTREVLIFRRSRELDPAAHADLRTYGEELWTLMAQLIARVPNVRSLSLSTDWFEVPFRRITDALNRMPSLRELRLIQVGDISQLLGIVCRQLNSIPALSHLYLRYSGAGSVYGNYIPPSDLDNLSPTPALEKVTLKIGDASHLSLQYISWLTRPRAGEVGFKLKSLALDLSSCYYNERGCFRALEACLETLDELWINVSGLGDGLLVDILASCRALRRLTLIVRHTFENSFFDRLPPTLEDITFDFSFEEENWRAWDQRFLCLVTCRSCPLRKIALRPVLDGSPRNFMDDKFPVCKATCKELGIEGDFSPSNDSRLSL